MKMGGSRGLMDRLVKWSCGFESQVWQELSGGELNNECSLHLRYHDWGEILEQGTEPPTAMYILYISSSAEALKRH